MKFVKGFHKSLAGEFFGLRFGVGKAAKQTKNSYLISLHQFEILLFIAGKNGVYHVVFFQPCVCSPHNFDVCLFLQK
jgi:hypothetical protein